MVQAVVAVTVEGLELGEMVVIMRVKLVAEAVEQDVVVVEAERSRSWSGQE